MRPHQARYSRILGVTAILCMLSATACDAARTPTATVTGQPPAQLASGPWDSIAPPTTKDTLLSWAVAPNDPTTLFVCTGAIGTTHDPPTPAALGTITLWRTTDTGRRWTRLPLSAATGTGCEITFAPDDPWMIAFAVTDWDYDRQPGDRNALFISRDSGATWVSIPHMPDLPTAQADDGTLQSEVAISARALYLWYSYGGGANTRQRSILERSEDGGASWTRIDAAFGAGALFFLPQIGPGGSLALSVLPAAPRSAPTQLWTSDDAGDTWRRVSDIPEYAGIFLLATPTKSGAWPAADSPFYSLISEQIPSSLYRERVVQTTDGQHWTALPPLPVPGTNSIQYGIFQALAVAPDGRLLVFGADPHTGIPTVADPPPAAFWLWTWNPQSRRWSVLTEPLAHSERLGCGLCWQAALATGPNGATYLYVAHWFDSGDDALFSIRLPESSAGTS